MLSAFELRDRSDRELLTGVKVLVAEEREATAQLIAHLGEIDARRLFLAEGCSSLFKYCTEILHLSESAAYNRIEVAMDVDAPNEGDSNSITCMPMPWAARRPPTTSRCGVELTTSTSQGFCLQEMERNLLAPGQVHAGRRRVPNTLTSTPAPDWSVT